MVSSLNYIVPEKLIARSIVQELYSVQLMWTCLCSSRTVRVKVKSFKRKSGRSAV